MRYGYTPEGDLVQVADSQRGTTQYEVDGAHRLVAEHAPDGGDYVYDHDPAGNVLSCSGIERIEVDTGNRLRRTSEETFVYDSRERLAERTSRAGVTTRYYYDSFDMLVRVERSERQSSWWPPRLLADDDDAVTPAPSNSDAHWQSWIAEYDAIGRRLSTRCGDRQRQFHWDGDRLAAEVSTDGRLRVYQYASPDAWIPLVFTDYPSRDAAPDTGRTYHVFTNPVGTPLRIEDADGKVVWWAERAEPYGLVELRQDSKIEYNLRWPGHYLDPETGLHYNRYRHYDPKLGRYLQSDPIGHEGSPTNLYAYCTNPLVQVDVLGLAHPAKTSGDSSEDGPHPNKGKEGTHSPHLPGVSPETRALAASDKKTDEARDARKQVVKAFLGEHGLEWDTEQECYRRPTDAEIHQQLNGHDLDKPVIVGPPPDCPSPQYQWQRPNGNQGSYYTDQNAVPTEVGIASYNKAPDGTEIPKVQKAYNIEDPNTPYLESTAAPTDDIWSAQA